MWTAFTIIIAIMIIWRIFFKTKRVKKATISTEKKVEYQKLGASEATKLFMPYKDRLQEFRDEEAKIAEVVCDVAASGDIEGVRLEEYREVANRVEKLGEEAQDLLWTIIFEREASEDKFQKVVDNISDLAGDIVQDIEEHISNLEDIIESVKSGDFNPDDFSYDMTMRGEGDKKEITRKDLFKGTKIPKKPKEPSYEILYANFKGKKSWWKISIHSRHENNRFEAWVYKEDEVVSLFFKLERILFAQDLKSGKEIKDFSILLEGVPLVED